MENGAGQGICLACHHFRASRVTLRAASTGKAMAMTVDTEVGRASLRPLGDSDYVYASQPQFYVRRDAGTGGWTIVPNTSAKNPTYVDGRHLTSQMALQDGAAVSVGLSRLRLTVQIEIIG